MTGPKLFRRDDVPEKGWVAFAYGPGESRRTGFITYEALAMLTPDLASPERMFDAEREAIIRIAVEKASRGKVDKAGRVLRQRRDGPGTGHRTAVGLDPLDNARHRRTLNRWCPMIGTASATGPSWRSATLPRRSSGRSPEQVIQRCLRLVTCDSDQSKVPPSVDECGRSWADGPGLGRGPTRRS